MARKKSLHQQYSAAFLKFMSYLDGRDYPKDKVFSVVELLRIQPSHVVKFFNRLAYGVDHPTENDHPTLCRSTTLEQYKKAISHYLPNKDMPWIIGPTGAAGNPTRARAVNDVIKEVRQAEVRKRGKKSCAKRDLKRPEFRMTLRIIERDATTIDLMIKAPTMMKMQFHLIGRTDDITNLETRDLRSHNKFNNFCLQTKVSWSKNVMEERDCPDQILLGSADPDFCVLVGLGCWLESRMTDNHGDPTYLFGHYADRDNEPQRINGWYQRTVSKTWSDPQFQELAAHVGGSLGTHSMRKFPATWAVENGCTQAQVETRGRWKGKKNGHIVNVYISVEQLPTDAKVAGLLCIGGPVKYQIKPDAGINNAWLGEHVVPHIADFFADDRSNSIAMVLGPALLWAAFTPGLEHMMTEAVRERITEAYEETRPAELDKDYNPVAKIPLTIYRVENALHIDECLPEAARDTRESNGEELARAQGMHANTEILNSILLQTHRCQQQLANSQQMICNDISQLRLFFGCQCGIINRNINRINTFALIPGRRIAGNGGAVAAGGGGAEGIGNGNGGGPPLAPTKPAELSRKPKDLYDLWKEYTHGLEGNKASSEFNARERGGKNKDKYCRRKNFWDTVDRFLAKGYNNRTAIDRIYATYGNSLTVTQIINKIKTDKQNGYHPNLR